MVSDTRGAANQLETATIDCSQNEIREAETQIPARQTNSSTSDLGNSGNRMLELKYFVARVMNMHK